MGKSQQDVTTEVDVLVVAYLIGQLFVLVPVQITDSIQTTILVFLHSLDGLKLPLSLTLTSLTLFLGTSLGFNSPTLCLLSCPVFHTDDDFVEHVVLVSRKLEVWVLLDALLQPVALDTSLVDFQFLLETLSEYELVRILAEHLVQLGILGEIELFLKLLRIPDIAANASVCLDNMVILGS